MDLSEINFSSRSNVTLLNPRLPSEQQHALRAVTLSFPDITGHFWLATSGSTEGPKLVAIKKDAILASAEAVNAHLNAKKSDRWCLALPTFHVGGLGIIARAHLSGSKVRDFPTWSALDFVSFCESESISLTSLVPTHVFDIISLGIRAPKSLRAVIIGGGSLSNRLYVRARELGWPLLPSYGMTEYGSQIATASLSTLDKNDNRLLVLRHAKTSTNEQGRLVISGASLFTGYAEVVGKKARFINPVINGEFLTDDLVELSSIGDEIYIAPKGRVTDVIKINGELVSLDNINSTLSSTVSSFPSITDSIVVAIPNARSGFQLVLVGNGNENDLGALYETLRQKLMPYERPTNYLRLETLPKSNLGKISLPLLREMLKKNYSSHDE